jgi:hypothetical protein
LDQLSLSIIVDDSAVVDDGQLIGGGVLSQRGELNQTSPISTAQDWLTDRVMKIFSYEGKFMNWREKRGWGPRATCRNS